MLIVENPNSFQKSTDDVSYLSKKYKKYEAKIMSRSIFFSPYNFSNSSLISRVTRSSSGLLLACFFFQTGFLAIISLDTDLVRSKVSQTCHSSGNRFPLTVSSQSSLSLSFSSSSSSLSSSSLSSWLPPWSFFMTKESHKNWCVNGLTFDWRQVLTN